MKEALAEFNEETIIYMNISDESHYIRTLST